MTPGAPLPTRFLDVAHQFPERIALATGDRAVTYGELARMAQHAASNISRVARAGGRVGLVCENSPEYVAAQYGCWLSGRAVVAFNPQMRARELGALARHACVDALLYDADHPEAEAFLRALEPGIAGVPVRELGASRGSVGVDALGGSDDLAAIVYTSGSTGAPKGVMLSHANLAANTASIQASLPIRADDRALCLLPFQYAYGASVLHTHLTLGATLFLERSLAYPHRVLERMQTDRVSSFAGVPSTFYLLLARTDLTAYDLGSLRYVTQAGGRMDPGRIEAFRTAVPSAEFFVMYGQTEATARLTCLHPDALASKSGSVGRPVPGVELKVDAIPGEVGEIHARGPNFMMGYWNDPQATADVLADGWLRTGDLGWIDEDGYVFIQGRAREIIKSGAFRIAPVEIEETIRTTPGVVDVAVIGVEDPILGEVVHAHVVADEPSEQTRQAIMRTCHELLAAYKLPKRIHFRDDLPRTHSGKIRKHLL